MKKILTTCHTKATVLLARCVILIMAVTFLAGCGSKISGTYVGTAGAHFEKLTFKSGGKVELTFLGSTTEATYVVEGDKVKISAAGQTQIFTTDKQGCLDGGGIIGKYCQDEPKKDEVKKVEVPSSPAEVMQAFEMAMMKEEPEPQFFWAALPAKYQSDVKGVISAYADKIDPALWRKAIAVVAKLKRVLAKKKDLLLNSGVVASIPDFAKNKEHISANWDHMTGALDALASSDIKTLDGVKKLDVKNFLAGPITKVIKAGRSIGPLPEKMKEVRERAQSTKYTLKGEITGDEATVEIQNDPKNPNAKFDRKLKRVDGKWLPADMVESWEEGLAEVKAAAAKIPAKAQLQPIVDQLDATLDKLLAGGEQAAFDAALGQALTDLMPKIQSLVPTK